jgi:hypothetical protein
MIPDKAEPPEVPEALEDGAYVREGLRHAAEGVL